MGDADLQVMKAEILHIKEKVDDIDHELKAMGLGSRIAVLEDRQNTMARMMYGIAAFFGTILSGIIIWLATGGH